MNAADVLARARAFATAAEPVAAERFGHGHVNDTFKVTDADDRAYILQRIGARAFKRPHEVMENIVLVTRHLAARQPSPRHRLTLVPARDGALWSDDDAGATWRMYDHIDGSTELSAPLSPADFRQVGVAFGRFLLDVADLPADRLHVTIPDYHNEPRYLALLKKAIVEDRVGRVRDAGPEIEQALSYEEFSHVFDDPELMELRVTHNDTKVSNVLVDAVTHEPLAVIDLDTVQPGLAVFDFGDSIRSGAVTAAEDEPDTDKVAFAPELFAAYAQGYLSACGDALTDAEIAHLRHGAGIATLETSLRFLTDYLVGDEYYRIERPRQNLDRCRTQLRLLDDLFAHWDWMGETIAQARLVR